MRKISILFSAFFIFFSAFSAVAFGLSQTPPTIIPDETPAVIERVVVTGARRFTEEQIQGVLTQQFGDRLNVEGVQLDLRAIAAMYRTETAAGVEAWSGFELITSQVTVTPDIVPARTGGVTLTYKIKEWFPAKHREHALRDASFSGNTVQKF